MFEKFSDYMYYLLFAPLKKVGKTANQFYIFFKVIGKLFDKVKALYFTVREESMVATCSEVMLYEHARDRKMTRYLNEETENFRLRIMMKAITAKMAGTKQGTILVVNSLGYSDVTYTPYYEIDSTRWAEFLIIITLDIDYATTVEYSVLRKAVRAIKQASAKDNYKFIHQGDVLEAEEIQTQIKCRTDLKWWPDNLTLDGKLLLDGAYKLDSEVVNCPLTITYKTETINQETITLA